MTTPKLVKCDTIPDLDPYHSDTGQETWTELWIDLEDGRYGLTQEHDNNSTSMAVWHGRQLSHRVAIRPDQDDAQHYLESDEAIELVQTILDGSEIAWDGSNLVGSLNDEALSAYNEFCSDVDDLPASDWALWRIDDWLSAYTPEIGPGTTNREIEDLAAECETAASDEHVILIGSVADWLYEQRDEQLNNPLTSAQAAALIGYTPDHLRRLLIAGKVRGKKYGRDWQIRPLDIWGIVPQRRRA